MPLQLVLAGESIISSVQSSKLIGYVTSTPTCPVQLNTKRGSPKAVGGRRQGSISMACCLRLYFVCVSIHRYSAAHSLTGEDWIFTVIICRACNERKNMASYQVALWPASCALAMAHAEGRSKARNAYPEWTHCGELKT